MDFGGFESLKDYQTWSIRFWRETFVKELMAYEILGELNNYSARVTGRWSAGRGVT